MRRSAARAATPVWHWCDPAGEETAVSGERVSPGHGDAVCRLHRPRGPVGGDYTLAIAASVI